MTINNPLADNSPDHEDQNLVLRARSGDRQALEDLVQRHQAWIYNIAVRMLHHPQDAEDVTPLSGTISPYPIVESVIRLK
jgi:hypothetical protein